MTTIRFASGTAPMPDGPIHTLTLVHPRKWWQFWRPRVTKRETYNLQFRDGRWISF